MGNADNKTDKISDKTDAPRAPKTLRLMRDGLVWQFGADWPSPPGHGKLPFRVTDIFYDDDDEAYVIFGQPAAKSAEERLGFCLMGVVPIEMGSAIVESLIPRDEAIREVSNYLAVSEEVWADRWNDEEDEAIDTDIAAAPPKGALS